MKLRASVLPKLDTEQVAPSTKRVKRVAKLLSERGFSVLSVGRGSVSVEGDEELFQSELGVDPVPGSHVPRDDDEQEQPELREIVAAVDFIPAPGLLSSR